MNQSEMSMSYGIVLYIDKHVNARIKSEVKREEKEEEEVYLLLQSCQNHPNWNDQTLELFVNSV